MLTSGAVSLDGAKHCNKCSSVMVFVYCYDNAQETDTDYAYNLYACDNCGSILKEDVWTNSGKIFISLDNKITTE